MHLKTPASLNTHHPPPKPYKQRYTPRRDALERRFPRRSSRATHLNPVVFKDVFCFFFGSPPTGGCGGGSGLSFPWETGGFVVIPARIRGGFRGRTWGNSSGGSDPGLTGLHTRAPVIVYRDPGIGSQHALSGSPTAQESEVYPQAGPGALPKIRLSWGPKAHGP